MITHRCLPILAAAMLAACAGPADRPIMLEGAEVLAPNQPPRVATARFTPDRGGQRMELVGTDGALFSGRLAREERPVLVPLAAGGTTPIGGETELLGDITDGARAMNCRFRLLNPARGVDGGGTGRCDGDAGRTVEFRF
jgi:hypothetical protein